MKTVVIVPTYNEAENILPLIDAIWKHAPSLAILVVDDASPDGTGKLVKDHPRFGDQLHLLAREGKLGLGSAYVAGMTHALANGFDAAIEFDADFSHDPAVLPSMLTQLQTSAVVIGSRYCPGGGVKNWGLFRRLLSRFGSAYARFILGMKIRDMTGGFNGWRRNVLETIDLRSVRSEGYAFQIELKYRAHRNHFGISEIPITFVDRRAGQSKMSLRIALEAFYRVWLLKFSSNIEPKLVTH